MESLDKIDNRIHLAKLMKKEQIAEGAIEFCFSLERKMDIEPGQYVWIELFKLNVEDPKGSRRAFSVADISDDRMCLSIILRVSDSGFNTTLRSVNIGDELNVIGPFGFSFLEPEDSAVPIVFVAGGIGITPFLRLIKHLLVGQRSK